MYAEVAQNFKEEDQVIPDGALPFEKALFNNQVSLHQAHRNIYYICKGGKPPQKDQNDLIHLGDDNIGSYYATQEAYALVMQS